MPDAEASISEEPGAGNPHAGICAGAVWATNRPTAMADSYTFGEELRMFPFSWHDEFVIPSPVVADLNVSEAVKRLAVAIKRQAPKQIDRTNNCVSFRAGMFRLAFGWNILVPIGQGSVCVCA